MTGSQESQFLNSLAQGICAIEEGKKWFKILSVEKQHEIIRELSIYAQQAMARNSDVQNAINKSGLKASYTPCVLARKGNLRAQLTKIVNLPRNEYEKIFILLLFLFSIADERRRRDQCKNNCSHWWHDPARLKRTGH